VPPVEEHEEWWVLSELTEAGAQAFLDYLTNLFGWIASNLAALLGLGSDLIFPNLPRLNHTSLTRNVGNTAAFRVENAGDQTVRWSSSNESIATVASNGTATGHAPGVVTITATVGNRSVSGHALFAPSQNDSDITRRYARWYRERNIGWPLGNRDDTFTVDGVPMAREDRRLNMFFPANNGVDCAGHFGHARAAGPHLGIDLVCPTAGGVIRGAPIIAVVDGYIRNRNTSWSGTGAGFMVSIESDIIDPSTGNRLIFTYMHMQNEAIPANNTRVRRGQIIGYVGDTGSPGAFHLHFEISNFTAWNGPGATRRERVTRRINPVYFYPAGSFQRAPRSNLSRHITIWNERR